jgi:methionyl-tRNA formyltransferase
VEVVFAGTAQFAVPSLEALVANGHGVRLVLTQPDRPSGRGLKVTPSPVKDAAERLELPIFQPDSLRDAAAQQHLAKTGARILITAAYGQIVPEAVLQSFPMGGINIHASLLPRYRGAAPVSAALLNADRRTGVTIFQMTPRLDDGDVLAMAEVGIEARDTALELTEKLSHLGAKLLVDLLPRLQRREVRPRPQDSDRVTYAPKLSREDGMVDWTKDAETIDRMVRALTPWPGTTADVCGASVKIIRGRPFEYRGPAARPGDCVKVGPEGMVIATGRGFFLVEELQRPGKRVSSASTLTSAVAVGASED